MARNNGISYKVYLGWGPMRGNHRTALPTLPSVPTLKGPTGFACIRDRLTGLGFDSPATLVAWTICLGTGIRLLLAASVVDLGHSEAYYIAASRHFALSYFSHPPLSFWIAWAAMKLTGSDAVLVVRAPFIFLFIATTWLMFRLTAFLFGETAGAFAALLLNISPLFTLSIGAWVQPDGPLILCVLAATYCVARLATGSDQGHPYLLWAQAGFWLGLALLSKYYAALLPVGVLTFAATSRDHRRWFREPGPYIACAIAILLFSPVLIWNWQNDWISFAFQGERVVEHPGISLRWLLDSTLGQAALIGPWIWIPMLFACAPAVREGRADSKSWLILCIASVPIVLFTLVALWMQTGGHYHWQAPGYLMLFPLLALLLVRKLETGDIFSKRWLFASTTAIFLIIGVIGMEAGTGWVHLLLGHHPSRADDLTLKGLEWKELRPAIATRGLLEKTRLFVVTSHRVEIGKIDVELGKNLPVVCLCPDPRDAAWDSRKFAGWDALIIGTQEHIPDVHRQYGKHFRRIDAIDEVDIHRAGRTVLKLRVYYATDYLGTYPLPLAWRAH
jgi:Dolichyl-phosphate-mannose-protein mannosyltransferase